MGNMVVKDLLLEDGLWNKNLIDATFDDREAGVIKAIPLAFLVAKIQPFGGSRSRALMW